MAQSLHFSLVDIMGMRVNLGSYAKKRLRRSIKMLIMSSGIGECKSLIYLLCFFAKHVVDYSCFI